MRRSLMMTVHVGPCGLQGGLECWTPRERALNRGECEIPKKDGIVPGQARPWLGISWNLQTMQYCILSVLQTPFSDKAWQA